MYNVGITALNACDSPTVGIPVIRCLKEHVEWKGKIIGFAYDSFEPGILDNYMINSGYLIPYPKSGKEALLKRIKYIHEKENLNIIIPNLDAEIVNFIQIKDELEKLRIKVFIPTEEQFRRRSKVYLNKLSADIGVKQLKTRVLTDLSNISIEKKDLPVVVKGVFYEAYVAYSQEEAIHCVHKVAARWGLPILIQEHVIGEEYNAAAVADGSGDVLGVVCMKKLIITDKGKGWAGLSIKNNEFIDIVRKIINSLKWCGAIEVEAILSKKDNCFYLLDINPRFPAWIYLSKAVGINLPFMYLKLALGEKVERQTDYKCGVIFTNYTTNLITELPKIESLITNGEIKYERTL